MNPAAPTPGTVESEFGVPIPGKILPPEQWARTALKHVPPGPLDFTALFGRSAPLIVDLGCGNGRYTLLSALARPDCNHFSSDILPAVVRYATRRANQRGLHNVRLAVKDAQAIVRESLAPGCAREIHVYHPQPYHDPRDADRRLITPHFLARVNQVLEPGGLIVLQTDNPDYWFYWKPIVALFFDFTEFENPWPDAPEGRSRREILSRSRGLRIFRGSGVKKDLPLEELQRLAQELPLPLFRTRGPWCDLDAIENEGGGERGGGDRRGKPGGKKPFHRGRPQHRRPK